MGNGMGVGVDGICPTYSVFPVLVFFVTVVFVEEAKTYLNMKSFMVKIGHFERILTRSDFDGQIF